MDGIRLIAVEWSLVSFTFTLVVLRLYARRYILSVQDALVVMAWIFFVTQATTDTLLYRMKFFADAGDFTGVPEKTQIAMLKIVFVASAIYYTGLYCVKAAMLCFFHSLIDRRHMKKTWIALLITTGVVVVGFILTTLVGFLWCQPVSRNWSLDPNKFCFTGQGIPYIIPIAFHLSTDVMIYSLAFPVVMAIARITSKERLAVGATFCIGFLCLVFGVGTFIMYERVPPTPWAALSAVLEQTWSVTVVCFPAFKIFFRRDVKRWTNKVATLKDSRMSLRSGPGSPSRLRFSWGSHAKEPREPAIVEELELGTK